MTLVDEFYKVGPGPSSSHTIGPMRITYDFYQRATKLPAAQLAQATALKVHLFGSLSATGKGHGTERAALAGLIGHEPATIDPVAVLDKMAAEPDKVYPVKLGSEDDQRLAQGHHLRRAQGRFPSRQHDDRQADGRRQGAAGAGILFGRRRLHRMEGLRAAQEEPAQISLFDDGGGARAHEARQHLARPARLCQRAGDFRPQQGRDQRLPRQDHRRDAGDREDRPQRAARQPCLGRSSSRPRQATSTRTR